MNISISFNGEEFALTEEEEHEGEATTEEHMDEGSDDGEHAVEGHAEAEVPNPVIPELNEMAWAAISFFLLWALMKYVLLPPLLKLRADREEKVLADREAADRAHASLAQAKTEYSASLASARAEADGIIDAARDEAGEHRSEVMGDATTEIAALRADAAGDLDNSRTAAIGSMKGDVGDIAVAAAAAVLGKDLDRGAQQGAIDAALAGDS